MRATSDFYSILEVPRDASREEIRVAYHRLMKAAHPDVCHHANAEHAASALNRAYETLGNNAKRAAYDMSLRAARRSSFGQSALVVTSVFLIAGSGVALWFALHHVLASPEQARAMAFAVQQLPATAANAATGPSPRSRRTELSLGLSGVERPRGVLPAVTQVPVLAAQTAPDALRDQSPALVAAVTGLPIAGVSEWNAPDLPQSAHVEPPHAQIPHAASSAPASPAPRSRLTARDEQESRRSAGVSPRREAEASVSSAPAAPRTGTRWPSADEPFFSSRH